MNFSVAAIGEKIVKALADLWVKEQSNPWAWHYKRRALKSEYEKWKKSGQEGTWRDYLIAKQKEYQNAKSPDNTGSA